MLPEPEHRGAVGDDGDEIALRGVRVGELGIALDLQARLSDARRVGERQVPLIGERLGRNDRDLSRAAVRVVVECVLAFGHGEHEQ